MEKEKEKENKSRHNTTQHNTAIDVLLLLSPCLNTKPTTPPLSLSSKKDHLSLSLFPKKAQQRKDLAQSVAMASEPRGSNLQSSTGAPRRSSSADGVKRPALDNGGAESWHGDSNKSPNNQLYQGRLGNKLSDSASPAREKKGSSGDGGKVNTSSASAGRSRFGGGGTKTDDSQHSEKNMAVPMFGAWNESDPSSAEDFTMIFTKARDTKMAGGDVNMAGPPKESTTGADYSASHKQQALATKQSSVRNDSYTICF